MFRPLESLLVVRERLPAVVVAWHGLRGRQSGLPQYLGPRGVEEGAEAVPHNLGVALARTSSHQWPATNPVPAIRHSSLPPP